MFKTIRNAFKVKELRGKILYTFMMLVVIRFGCQLPIPGIETSFFANWFAKQTTDVFGFFNAMTGGSFSSMSIFALSITWRAPKIFPFLWKWTGCIFLTRFRLKS